MVSQNAAILNANINPRGTLTTVWFDYGTNTVFNHNQRTSSQIIGNSWDNIYFSAPVSGLLQDTVHYFRIVAQNQYGMSYGNINSFRTSTSGIIYSPTPMPTKTPTPIIPGGPITPTNGGQDISCLKVNPSLSPTFPKAGQEFNYTPTYRNNCSTDFTNASIKIILPMEVEFLATNLLYFAEGNNSYVYNASTISRDIDSSIAIRGKIKDSAHKNDTLLFSAAINFNDQSGKFRSIISNLSDSVGENKGSSLFGSISAFFGDISSGVIGWILFLVLIFVILFLAFLLASGRRQERYKQI